MKVTLDMNSIIDLERDNSWAPYIRELILMHRNKKINLQIAAISAAERKPDRTEIKHFDEFKKRIEILGLIDVEILKTISYLGISFLGYSVLAGGKLSDR